MDATSQQSHTLALHGGIHFAPLRLAVVCGDVCAVQGRRAPTITGQPTHQKPDPGARVFRGGYTMVWTRCNRQQRKSGGLAVAVVVDVFRIAAPEWVWPGRRIAGPVRSTVSPGGPWRHAVHVLRGDAHGRPAGAGRRAGERQPGGRGWRRPMAVGVALRIGFQLEGNPRGCQGVQMQTMLDMEMF